MVDKGTGRRGQDLDGRAQAGKTGTIDSNEAVWFAGYTPEIAGVAMISIDNTKKPFIKRGASYYRRGGVKGYTVPSTGFYLEGSGSGDAGMKIWKPVMQKYLQQIPRTSFNSRRAGSRSASRSGAEPLRPERSRAATRKLEKAGFTVEKQLRLQRQRAAVRLHRLVTRARFVGSPSSARSTRVYSRGRDPAEVAAEQQAEARRRQQEKKRQQRQKQTTAAAAATAARPQAAARSSASR